MLKNEERLLSKEQLSDWIRKDRISCGFKPERNFKEFLTTIIAPNYVLQFLRLLRKCEFLTNSQRSSRITMLPLMVCRLKLRSLQLKLGFSIPLNVFRPGLSIAHYGTLVVNPNASIGDNCRIHVGVNIGASGGSEKAPTIGNNVYIGPGAILFGGITIADNVSIGANSTVTKSFLTPNVVVAGTPAKIVKEFSKAWNE